MTNRKIYYCSLFFNELLLTHLKFSELYDHVDYFVISESNKSHSNLDKPFYKYAKFLCNSLNENKSMFEKFSSKVIHQKLYDDPQDFVNLKTDPNKDLWYNNVVNKINAHLHYQKTNIPYCMDSWQKESLIRALGQSGTKDEDLIFLMDADELVKPEYIDWLRNNFDDNLTYYFGSQVSYYYANLIKNEPWECPFVMTFKKFKQTSFCVARNFKQGGIFPNSAYHFSYMGGIDKIKTKIENFGEQSLNRKNIKDNLAYMVNNAVQLGRDLYGRECQFKKVPVTTEFLPKSLCENQEYYKDLILPLDKPTNP